MEINDEVRLLRECIEKLCEILQNRDPDKVGYWSEIQDVVFALQQMDDPEQG